MKTRRLTRLSFLAAAVVLAAAASRGAAQQPDPRTDARLERPVSVEVRSADVRDVVTRLADALDVEMTSQPGLAGRRVTLFASKASLFSIQQALAALYHARWQRSGDGDTSRYELVHNATLETQADRIRQTRRAQFVNLLLQTEADLRRRDPDVVAAEFRLDVSGRVPDLTGRSLEDLTPDFIRQTLLLAPVRMGMTSALVRNGGVWAAFQDLPPAYQQLAADFYLYREDPNAVRAVADAGNGERIEGAAEPVRGSEGVLGPQALGYPQARLEYRLLYGDRWTGPVLLVRVGSSDNWGTAMMPSVLFDLPDYSALYPEAAVHPGDPMLDRNLNVRIDTAALTWDQAIATIGRAAGLNVLTDSYLRPAVFRPKGPSPVIVGTTIRETLDRTARYYGYVWWRHGDFFLFRHRHWADEQRVSPPDRVIQGISASLAANGRLGGADWKALSALTDEQLLTLNLYGKSAGRPYVPPDSLDLNEIQLVQLALMMAAPMTEAQLSMARRDGLPYYRMSDAQQQLFVYAAYDRGLPLIWEEATRWRWRIDESFSRQRFTAGWAEAGTAKFTFDFGPAGRRSTELALRVPAAEKAKD